MVNTTQKAFVEGKYILDASLIANGVIDSMMRRKGKRHFMQIKCGEGL